MTKNVKLIYDLIQKDLKAQGWEDEAVTEAIAESQRERLATGADDKTICVKEMSYLSQESLQLLASMMDNKQVKGNIFIRTKNRFVSLAKDFWRLNWEAKIGILFLIPPIIGVLLFIPRILWLPDLVLKSFLINGTAFIVQIMDITVILTLLMGGHMVMQLRRQFLCI